MIRISTDEYRRALIMAARKFVAAALAAVGAAAAGGMSGLGAPPSVAVAPINAVSPLSCVTDGSETERRGRGALDLASAPRASSLDTALDRADDGSRGAGGSGPLTARGRTGEESISQDATSEPVSADELAQALAESLAGRTNPAARRIAAALAAEGFVATERSAASDRIVPVSDENARVARAVETDEADEANCTRSGPRLAEEGIGSRRNDRSGGSDGRAGDDGFESVASVLDRTAASPGRGDG
jgi:hypothetical protein